MRESSLSLAWMYTALAVFIVILWFATLSARPLFNTDEGRYAEIPREMLSGGDWVIPHLDGLTYIEKPPLQYWATALSLKVFGINEFAARLYTALCAVLTLTVIFISASKLWDRQTGVRAVAVLAGMLLFLVMGQLLTLDMSLTFYMTLSLSAFLLAQRSMPSLGWMLLAWSAAGLGVLTKGVVAAVIPAAVLILYSSMARDFSPWRRLYWLPGLSLFLLITVPWHWLAAGRLPDFVEFFFVHEHLSRFLTPSADRQEAWWFFGAVFLAGSMPWTLPALRVLVATPTSRMQSPTFNMQFFLWVWIVFVLGFFSLSDSKLIPYVLPAMPALALLIAVQPLARLQRDFLWTAGFSMLVSLGLLLASWRWPYLIKASERSVYLLHLARPLLQIGLLLGVSGAYVLAERARDTTRAAVILGAAWCLSGLLLLRAAAWLAPIYSGAGLAAAASGIPRSITVYSVGTYDQTLAFYWRHTLKLVDYRGELDYGLRHQCGADIASLSQFLDQWSRETTAYAVMERSLFEKLKTQGVPMRELSRNVQRVLVAR